MKQGNYSYKDICIYRLRFIIHEYFDEEKMQKTVFFK